MAAKPFLKVNRLLKAGNNATIKVDAPFEFENENARAAFAAYLGGVVPPGVGGMAFWVAVPFASTSAGNPGDVARSDDYFFVYLGDGTTHVWGRIPINREW
jgi:hypothetical protein